MVGSGRGRAMKFVRSMGSAALTGLTTASIASAAESRRDMGTSSIGAQWGLYDPHMQELEYHPLHLIQVPGSNSRPRARRLGRACSAGGPPRARGILGAPKQARTLARRVPEAHRPLMSHGAGVRGG